MGFTITADGATTDAADSFGVGMVGSEPKDPDVVGDMESDGSPAAEAGENSDRLPREAADGINPTPAGCVCEVELYIPSHWVVYDCLPRYSCAMCMVAVPWVGSYNYYKLIGEGGHAAYYIAR